MIDAARRGSLRPDLKAAVARVTLPLRRFVGEVVRWRPKRRVQYEKAG